MFNDRLHYTETSDSDQNKIGILNVTNEPVNPNTQFKSTKVKTFYKWWSEIKSDYPRFKSFDIIEHLGSASSLFLYKVHHRDFMEIRINGEATRDILGSAFHDTIVDQEHAKKDKYIASLLTYLQTIFDSKTPRVCVGSYRNKIGQVCNFQSIDCPLFDENDNISHIVGILEEVE